MADEPRFLNRSELAEFLPSQRAIRAFESLFRTVIELTAVVTPSGLTSNPQVSESFAADIAELVLAVSQLRAQTEEGADDLIDISGELEVQEDQLSIPFVESDVDDLLGRDELGTIASQNADDVDVTGGSIDADLTDNSTDLLASSQTLSDNSGAAAGTLGNAPTAGDPAKWIAIDDNGTTRYIPTWT